MQQELMRKLSLRAPDSRWLTSFYSYPNTHFSQAQKNQILNGPYGSFLS